MTEKLTVVYRELADLVPYARNARTHSDVQIAAIVSSVREFGWTNPVLVDEGGGIIAGHGRVLAAQKLGLGTVPTITLAGLSEVQKRAYVLADNKLALDAGWDAELLALELIDLRDAGYALSLAGFSDEELAELLRGTAPAGEIDEDTPPEPPDNPITKLGDVWQLGRHRLICGDSTDPKALARLLEGRKVGLLATDPPYGVEAKTGTRNPHSPAYQKGAERNRSIENDDLKQPELEQMLRGAFEVALGHMSPGASWYVWFAGTHSRAFISATDVLGGFRHQLVWVKSKFVFGRCDYHYRHEPCLYGWVPGAAHTWLGSRNQSSVFELRLDKAVGELVHPSVKPVELWAVPISNHLGADGGVLDLFAGTGPAFSAAEQLGRTCYGVELSPAYCDVIVQRWEKLTSAKATRG